MARSSMVPEAYDGHEQSFIKHELLKSYLQKLFFIIGSSARSGGQIELCYVDCFAGPWGDESEGMESTSIAISLQTLDMVRQKLGINGVSARIRALYVEKDARAYARLAAYLQGNTPHGIHAEPRQGDFVALRDDILGWAGKDAFTFFFIDPKGWKGVEIGTLRPLLARPRSEFLINFMYDFVNRAMSIAELQTDMAQLVGESLNLDNMAPDERERQILRTYRANLKRCVTATRPQFPPRSAYARVLDRARERPKYHLVYVTSHPLGIVKFMTISEDVDLVQKQVRAEVKDAERERRTGTGNLFATPIDPAVGHVSAEDVDQFWRDYIGEATRRVDLQAFAGILENKDWFPGDLQASLLRLIDAGEITNLDATKRRPKKPLHFDADNGERLQRIRRRA
jgi:three-Cys-motif partner protein